MILRKRNFITWPQKTGPILLEISGNSSVKKWFIKDQPNAIINTSKGGTQKPRLQAMKTTTTIEIRESYKSQRLPLYAKDRDGRQLPAHINLNQRGEVFASHAEEIGNVGMDVWKRQRLQWEIPTNILGWALDRLIDELKPLLERVHNGHTVDYDANNNIVVTLSSDAEDASDEIGKVISEIGEIWLATEGLDEEE